MSNTTTLADQIKAPLFSVSLLALAAAMPTAALAQESGSADQKPTVSSKRATAPSSTINLLNVLVKQGVLNEEQAQVLIKQAEDEAYVAREAARDATAKAGEAAKAASAAAAAASPPGSKRVTYVPEVVKKQLREDIRKEVMSQAKKEGWASPGTYPEWASRIRFSGDFRGRFEGMWHPSGGYNSIGELFDFNAINTGSPYDTSDLTQRNPPLINTGQDRDRFRLRARLGMEADLYEGFTAGMRIATGSDASPVSTNQTLGGSGGNFSKYGLWLDRAFLKYDPLQYPDVSRFRPQSAVALTVGRFDNPFWAATDLVWDTDLGFDGVAIQARHEILPDITPFFVAGAFPIFNTSLNAGTTNTVKFKSEDKYLLGGQIGLAWKATPNIEMTFGAGLFDFSNVKGRQSTPCDVSVSDGCDTDTLRPLFAQKGNTYMELRNIVPPSGWNGVDDYAMPQYYGLVAAFRPAVFSARADLGHFSPVHIMVDGEYVWNTAFDPKSVDSNLVFNNLGPVEPGYQYGRYEGGNMGWMTRLTVGHKKLTQFGDWNVHVAYKYLESDAVMDAFADSDFGLGGTNLKGYIVGANYALSQNVSASARWLSANAIAGAPYSVDTFQLDLNAKF